MLDERGGVVASSRRARELLPELAEGSAPPPFAEAARVAYTVGDAAGTLDDVLLLSVLETGREVVALTR